jgi:sulfur relay (sulfurtransferase) complex TusBCD TusD component (DsrE family)
LLFRRLCRIMPHEQEIFKHRYRETGKIAHTGQAYGVRLRLCVSCRQRQGIFCCPEGNG